MKNLTNENLLEEMKLAVARERVAITEVLHYLAEVESRQLHLARGFSSLWEFATKFLGYSESEAYSRIQAMRLLREIPSAEKDLREGNISLTVAANTQSAFVKESKNRAIAREEKQKLLEEVKGKSKREAEVILLNHFSVPRNDALEKLVIHATPEMIAKMEKLKGLWAHKNFEGDISKLFELMLDHALKESPVRSAAKPMRSRSRYIPRAVRREVWKRSKKHECNYVDPVTGRKCGSRHALEIDHIQEWSRGGTNDLKNLRLLCSAHNKFRNFESAG